MDNLRSILALRPDLIQRVEAHVRIDNPPFLPLSIENIGTGPRGLPALSVAHYGEQNGDLMCDPEICFELAIENGTVKEFYPFYFRNDYVGVEQFSVHAQGFDSENQPILHINLPMVNGQRAFAATWDRNIGDQGFVAKLHESVQPSTE